MYVLQSLAQTLNKKFGSFNFRLYCFYILYTKSIQIYFISSLIILFSEFQAACGLKLNPRGAGTEIIQNQIYV